VVRRAADEWADRPRLGAVSAAAPAPPDDVPRPSVAPGVAAAVRVRARDLPRLPGLVVRAVVARADVAPRDGGAARARFAAPARVEIPRVHGRLDAAAADDAVAPDHPLAPRPRPRIAVIRVREVRRQRHGAFGVEESAAFGERVVAVVPLGG